MRKLLMIFSTLVLFYSISFAGYDEQKFTSYFVGEKLDVENDSTRFYFSLPDSGAVLINFVLSSNTDWEECGNESAILDVCADQDSLTRQSVVVYNGRKKTEYARYLWELSAGDHFIDLVFNPEKSAPGAEFVRIDSIKIAVVSPDDPYYWPCILCPYLNTFKDYSKNDVPLLIYYNEWLNGTSKRYFYSIVLSQDDCHLDELQDWSQLRLLDRASSMDIEWLYDVTIDVAGDSLAFVEKYYQARGHTKTVYFETMRNYHPELSVATQNNNFATGCMSGEYPQFLPPVKITTDLYGFLHPYIEKHPEFYTTWVKEIRRDYGMYDMDCKNPDAPWIYARGYVHNPEKFRTTDPVYHLFFEYVLSGNNGMKFNISAKVKNDTSWYGRDVLSNNGRRWQSIVLPEETIKLENIDTLRISVSGDAGIEVGVDIDRIWYFDENINLISHHLNFPESQKISAENPEIKYAMSELFSDELSLHECKINVVDNMIEFMLPYTGDLNGNSAAMLGIKGSEELNYQYVDMQRTGGMFSCVLTKSEFPDVYDIMISGIDEDGVSGYKPQYLEEIDFSTMTTVNGGLASVPDQFELKNYPNPFNNTTSIYYFIPRKAHVTIEIYNSIGQLVEVLYDGEHDVGEHQFVWNAHQNSTGIYFCKLKTTSNVLVTKLLYLK